LNGTRVRLSPRLVAARALHDPRRAHEDRPLLPYPRDRTVPGSPAPHPTSQLINLSVGVSGFGFSNSASTSSSPFPRACFDRSAPAAAGSKRVHRRRRRLQDLLKVVPREVKAGEPITWTVELTGSGNWPRSGSAFAGGPRDFQVIQPKPKRTQTRASCSRGRYLRMSCSSPPGPVPSTFRR